MTKKLYAVVFVFSLLGFCSCQSASQNVKSDSAVDWEGVYTGTVPGADTSINVEIALKKDGTYTVSYQYDKTDDVSAYAGTFTWKDDTTVELDTNELPPYYLVGNNTLTQLDMAGKTIDGEHAALYVLIKK